MKKIICISLLVCIMCFFSACNTENTEILPQTTPTPTAEIQASVLPLTFTDREQFSERVLAEHRDYNETYVLSDYHLAEIEYYLDFVTLPEGAILQEIVIPEFCNYISLKYELKNQEINLTWYRVDFGNGYDHFESSKIATSGLPQKMITLDGQSILEVYHQQSETTVFDHYSYHWEQNGDYIDMVISSGLVEEYGAEAFLSIKKATIDFGDITPAIVATPSPGPTSTPVPDVGPTKAPPVVQNNIEEMSSDFSKTVKGVPSEDVSKKVTPTKAPLHEMNIPEQETQETTYGEDPSSWCGVVAPDPTATQTP